MSIPLTKAIYEENRETIIHGLRCFVDSITLISDLT